MEAQLNKKLQAVFARVASETLRALNAIGVTPSGDLQYKRVVAPLENVGAEFTKTLSDSAEQAGQYGRNKTLSHLKNPITKLPPAAAQLLRAKTYDASQQTMQRLVGDVMGSLANSQREGLGIKEAAARLKLEFDRMHDYELRRIARTEIISAQNIATEQTEMELGIAFHQWWTAQDDRVRDGIISHVDMQGQITRVGDLFSNGLEHPCDRSGDIEEWINCRCRLVPFLMPLGKKAPTGQIWFYEYDLINR